MLTISPSMLGSYPPSSYTSLASSSIYVCQLCNNEGHITPSRGFRGYERIKYTIYGKSNHMTRHCFYNENGPNFVGSISASPDPSSQHHALHAMHKIFLSS